MRGRGYELSRLLFGLQRCPTCSVALLLLSPGTEGLSSTAIQQGGIGLLLSLLIVSVPPMAAMFFQGTLGSALTYSVFRNSGGRPGPQGQPAGMVMNAPPGGTTSGQHGNSRSNDFANRYAGAAPTRQNDEIKQA